MHFPRLGNFPVYNNSIHLISLKPDSKVVTLGKQNLFIMKNKLYILATVLFFSSIAHAQITMEYLDINHVKAGVLTHGDMFWNPTAGTASYQFPQGSNLNSNFASSIWIAGYDTSGNLHISAQTYRQDGNDYWPGPLDNTGTLTSSLSNDWDKIWKVNKTTIDSFLASPTHTVANTPAVILQWPAKGNINAKGKAGVSLTITKDMAPFFDVNGDGRSRSRSRSRSR
jgi:hypothetical protein